MTLSSILRTALLCSFTLGPACTSTRAVRNPAETNLSANLVQMAQSKFFPLVDPSQPKEKRYQSILVAIVTPFGTEYLPLGKLSEKGETANERTIFEIGSITKGFVGLQLAKESLQGNLNLDEPYNRKARFKLPNFNGNQITWRHLAQHTAGLPRVPNNINSPDPLQPYLEYDKIKLKSFLKNLKLKIEPGTQSDYSNLGAGLAALGLEGLHRKGLDKILQEGFINPLHMNDTRIELTAEQTSRLTPVFTNGEPGQVWKYKSTSVLQGAGALHSTANDLSILMRTMMGLPAQDNTPMVELATKPTFKESANSQLGLFWNYLKSENIIWHNGGTYGSTSFFGYDPDALVGVIALSNSSLIGKNDIDHRIDLASIAVIKDVVASLKMDKPIKILKAYDQEIEHRNSEFAKTPADPQNKEWVKSKLAHMYDIDQYMRQLTIKSSELGFSPDEKKLFDLGYSRRFYMMDWQNTRDLKSLLKIHGWFNISKWGAKTDQQAWLLVQHADNQPQFQKDILKLLSKLYRKKETSPANYAYLYDRVASSFHDPSKRKPQGYGTQGSCVGPGKWEPLPIENPSHVDERRKEVGLGSMQDYIAVFKDICK